MHLTSTQLDNPKFYYSISLADYLTEWIITIFVSWYDPAGNGTPTFEHRTRYHKAFYRLECWEKPKLSNMADKSLFCADVIKKPTMYSKKNAWPIASLTQLSTSWYVWIKYWKKREKNKRCYWIAYVCSSNEIAYSLNLLQRGANMNDRFTYDKWNKCWTVQYPVQLLKPPTTRKMFGGEMCPVDNDISSGGKAFGRIITVKWEDWGDHRTFELPVF